MAVMSRLLPIGLGGVSVLTTAALMAFQIIVAVDASRSIRVQVSAVLSAALEAIVLGLIAWMCTRYRSKNGATGQSRRLLILAITLTTSVLATAASISNLILLRIASTSVSDPVMGTTGENVLTGTSTVLALSFICQLAFFFVNFFWPPTSTAGTAMSQTDAHRIPQMHVKAVRYSRTISVDAEKASGPFGSKTNDFITPPQSSSGASATETMSSIRSSLSNVVRPMSSKTRLLSSRDRYRQGSLDGSPYREGSIATQDSFDSWDTSSVDLHSRMTVLGTASPSSAPPQRLLETIPASPTTSRSPSPGCPLDLEPPRLRNRSRSFSPARRSQLEPLQQDLEAPGEAHIHPLFRSDSPVPPPNVTPGTVVIAAPEAARVISDRQSVRRMRSSSLTARESPLSHQASYETFRASPSLEEREEVELDLSVVAEERTLTPPIPDWILSAGSRTSLNGYESRKIRVGN
ncbi:hypothetical protein F5X68DRAFT_207397 [Plectosphaerella plurivora]|uniref:Uncharacterized protein n=1 Tax=Plectosphaerella plurivora TaxID=936078 RepID=A0A9P9AB58_9PEZI|nr:hypothetical protein F5X68DRAFT_207397 [Plectosphaerella plurivora]